MTVLSAKVASFLLPVALLFLQPWTSQLPAKVSSFEDDRCSARSLPPDIQNYLKTNFDAWKTQQPQDLSEFARISWMGRKSQSCPGIAAGKFQSMKSPSYAVLLVAADRTDRGYRFVIFNPKVAQSSYDATIVETYDQSGGSNYFIQKALVSDWFDAASKKKFQVQTQEAIVMVDSAEQEYGAEIYFWSNGSFRHEPIDN